MQVVAATNLAVVVYFLGPFVAPRLAAGELLRPAMLLENGVPLRLRAMRRFPVALWAFPRIWHMPWPFAPCAMQRPVASSSVGVAVEVRQVLALARAERPQRLKLDQMRLFAAVCPRQPMRLVAYAVAIVVEHSYELAAVVAAAAVGSSASAGVRTLSYGRLVPSVEQPYAAVAVAAVAGAFPVPAAPQRSWFPFLR